MKNLRALLRLEQSFITTYWKYVLLFLGIAIVMGVSMRSGINFIFTSMIFVSVLTLFAFEFTDKSNLNVLYGTLPTNRKSIVTARYSFMVILLFIGGLIALLGGVIIQLAFNQRVAVTDTFAVLAMSIGVYLVFTAWNTPFLFKFGYQKGRVFFWVFMIVFMIVFNLQGLLSAVGVSINFNVFTIAFGNVVKTGLIALGIGVAVFIASFFISQRIYKKKDF